MMANPAATMPTTIPTPTPDIADRVLAEIPRAIRTESYHGASGVRRTADTPSVTRRSTHNGEDFLTSVQSCLADQNVLNKVAAITDLGNKDGIGGTPNFVINGKTQAPDVADWKTLEPILRAAIG